MGHRTHNIYPNDSWPDPNKGIIFDSAVMTQKTCPHCGSVSIVNGTYIPPCPVCSRPGVNKTEILAQNIRGFAPRPGGEHPVSRDYAIGSIPCKCEVCACNKNGSCEMPSAIKISAAGVCETGQKYVKKALE